MLDNLPERENSVGGSQCTTPCTQSGSASQRRMDLTDNIAARPTDASSLARCVGPDSSKSAGCESEITASVQSTSTAGELQSQTANSDTATSRLITVSNGYHQSAQNVPHSTSQRQFYNVCQEQRWSPASMTDRQLSHSNVIRDIPPTCRPITVPSSCGRDGPSPLTATRTTGRSEPVCVTTPSRTGRGGLSACDSGSRHELIPDSAAQSHAYSRPLINSDRRRAALSSSAGRHYDGVTTRS